MCPYFFGRTKSRCRIWVIFVFSRFGGADLERLCLQCAPLPSYCSVPLFSSHSRCCRASPQRSFFRERWSSRHSAEGLCHYQALLQFSKVFHQSSAALSAFIWCVRVWGLNWWLKQSHQRFSSASPCFCRPSWVRCASKAIKGSTSGCVCLSRSFTPAILQVPLLCGVAGFSRKPMACLTSFVFSRTR